MGEEKALEHALALSFPVCRLAPEEKPSATGRLRALRQRAMGGDGSCGLGSCLATEPLQSDFTAHSHIVSKVPGPRFSKGNCLDMYTSALFHRYPPGQPLSLEMQVERGALVCPRTHVRLVLNADKTCLVTTDGKTSYLVENGVPFLVEERSTAAEYAASSSQMSQEYSEFERPNALARAKMLIIRFFNATWQSKASMAAHEKTFAIPEGGLCLSVGGGPTRTHPRAVNLNIGPFPHVDVVADAHRLPYADGSVDSLVCEDVLEHIRDPLRVVQEFHRVLKPGASVYCATPFLISYHGYPFHFQNFKMYILFSFN